MPSELGQEFNDVSRYPYMAVASPSCHDTTTTRSWWEEDAGRRERFFAEELHMQVPSVYLYLKHQSSLSVSGGMVQQQQAAAALHTLIGTKLCSRLLTICIVIVASHC